MWHDIVLDREFFAALLAIDAEIAVRIRAGGCPRCGGPLCVGHYERKPRGGRFAAAGTSELFSQRFSWCCGREGCRKRATPPSVRFLGRKVYLEGAILIACALVPLIEQTAAAIRDATGIAARTIRRWEAWWRSVFVASAIFTELRARAPSIDPAALPGAMIESFDGATPITRLEQTMRFVAPITTASIAPITMIAGRT
jgi:hypothetical protein